MQDFVDGFAEDLKKIIQQRRDKVWLNAEKDLTEIVEMMSQSIQKVTDRKFELEISRHPVSDSWVTLHVWLYRVNWAGSEKISRSRFGIVHKFRMHTNGAYPLGFFTVAKEVNGQSEAQIVSIGNKKDLLAVSLFAFHDPQSTLIRHLAED
jgi:hypothetical protein